MKCAAAKDKWCSKHQRNYPKIASRCVKVNQTASLARFSRRESSNPSLCFFFALCFVSSVRCDLIVRPATKDRNENELLSTWRHRNLDDNRLSSIHKSRMWSLYCYTSLRLFFVGGVPEGTLQQNTAASFMFFFPRRKKHVRRVSCDGNRWQSQLAEYVHLSRWARAERSWCSSPDLASTLSHYDALLLHRFWVRRRILIGLSCVQSSVCAKLYLSLLDWRLRSLVARLQIWKKLKRAVHRFLITCLATRHQQKTTEAHTQPPRK